MRKYECFFMIQPELSEEAMAAVSAKLQGVVETNGGTIVSYDPWGKKKLAYPVKKNSYGYYILMTFASGPELVTELERIMRLDERVLKFITVKLEDVYSPEPEQDVETEAVDQSSSEEEETASEQTTEDEPAEVEESSGE